MVAIGTNCKLFLGDKEIAGVGSWRMHSFKTDEAADRFVEELNKLYRINQSFRTRMSDISSQGLRYFLSGRSHRLQTFWRNPLFRVFGAGSD